MQNADFAASSSLYKLTESKKKEGGHSNICRFWGGRGEGLGSKGAP